MDNLQGLLQFAAAQNAQAESQAKVGSTLADIPQKLAQADLTETQAINQDLRNVALLYGIEWDVQAQDHLWRLIIQCEQSVRALKDKAEALIGHVKWANRLMNAPTYTDAVSYGWLGFEYLRGLAAGMSAAVLATAKPEIYARESWSHPTHEIKDSPAHNDPGALLNWARQRNYYPVIGGAAWLFMSAYASALDDAAATEAANINARIATAEKSADTLNDRLLDRLKTPAGNPSGAGK